MQEYRTRARGAGLTWPLAEEWTDGELEARLFAAARPSNVERPLPDWNEVHREMKARRRTSVTLQLLWLEYKEQHPDGLQYSQFCELYRRWRGGLDRVLRQCNRERLHPVEVPMPLGGWPANGQRSSPSRQ